MFKKRNQFLTCPAGQCPCTQSPSHTKNLIEHEIVFCLGRLLEKPSGLLAVCSESSSRACCLSRDKCCNWAPSSPLSWAPCSLFCRVSSLCSCPPLDADLALRPLGSSHRRSSNLTFRSSCIQLELSFDLFHSDRWLQSVSRDAPPYRAAEARLCGARSVLHMVTALAVACPMRVCMSANRALTYLRMCVVFRCVCGCRCAAAAGWSLPLPKRWLLLPLSYRERTATQTKVETPGFLNAGENSVVSRLLRCKRQEVLRVAFSLPTCTTPWLRLPDVAVLIAMSGAVGRRWLIDRYRRHSVLNVAKVRLLTRLDHASGCVPAGRSLSPPLFDVWCDSIMPRDAFPLAGRCRRLSDFECDSIMPGMRSR